LDEMAEKALTAALSTEEATRQLYGDVWVRGRVTKVALAVSISTGPAAAIALNWGMDCKFNAAFRTTGAQTGGRAVLLGVLRAVMECETDRSLEITTNSEYAIRAVCYWAGDNANRGWSCTNADVLQEIARRVRARAAPMELRWAAGTNSLISEAKRMA
ncbi:hypothetical protein C8R45DRAFT_775596, partial [Mycena sanguinolenta]